MLVSAVSHLEVLFLSFKTKRIINRIFRYYGDLGNLED